MLRYKSYHIAWFALSILIMSCDIFDTRDPQEPNSGNITFRPASTKDILFSNFQEAFRQKNSYEYSKLFSDSATHSQQFVFIPTASAGARYAFSAWDIKQENEYFQNIIPSVENSSPLGFIVEKYNEDYTIADSTKYTFNYVLFVPHNRGGITQQFVGKGEIYISPDKTSILRIYRWVDFETKKDSSWSELKGQFAN